MAWWDIGGDLTNLAQRAFGSTPEAGYYLAAPAAAAAPASSGGGGGSLKSFLAPGGGGKGAQQLAEQTKIARESQRTGQRMAEGAAGAAAPLVGYGKEQLALVEADNLMVQSKTHRRKRLASAWGGCQGKYWRIGQGDS